MSKTRQAVRGIIARYKMALENLGIHAEGIILYGSFASCKPRKDSDIDLIVISNDFRELNLRERLEVLGVAAARIMQPIEARGYTPREIEEVSPPSFLNEVVKLGVSV